MPQAEGPASSGKQVSCANTLAAASATAHSADGTGILPTSGTTLTSSHGTWKFGTINNSFGTEILLNDQPTTGYATSLYIAQQGEVFAVNALDATYNWTLQNGRYAWKLLPVSPEGADLEPTDVGMMLVTPKNTWTFSTKTNLGGNIILRNGKTQGAGNLLLLYQGTLYARNVQNTWYKWNTALSAWTRSTAGDPTQVSGTRPSFTHTLARTWTGPEVVALQSTLSKLGFYNDELTGYFGERTEQAVKKFQMHNNLAAVGIVGPQTRSLLERLLGN